MGGLPFDRGLTDALLAGKIAPDDVPGELRSLAALIRAARPAAAPEGFVAESDVVAAFSAGRRAQPSLATADRHRRKSLLAKALTAKAAAVVATFALGGAAAAAATGSLPAPVQSALSKGLAHVGIALPKPATQIATGSIGSGEAPVRPTTTTTIPPGAAYGLCTAYEAATPHTGTGTSAPAAKNTYPGLTATAKAAGETVQQYCASIPPPSGDTAAGSPTITGGKPGTGTTGPPSTTGSGTGTGTPTGGQPTNGHGHGHGQGQGQANGASHGNGNGNGNGASHGNGNGPNGASHGNGNGNGSNGASHGNGNGNGSNGASHGNGHGSSSSHGPAATSQGSTPGRS